MQKDLSSGVKQRRDQARVVVVVSGFVFVLLCALPLFFVSPLDVATGRAISVTNFSPDSQNSISVVQIWNYSDFYTTLLIHQTPTGDYAIVLDGDAAKWWGGCEIIADSEASSVRIERRTTSIGEYNWQSREFIRIIEGAPVTFEMFDGPGIRSLNLPGLESFLSKDIGMNRSI